MPCIYPHVTRLTATGCHLQRPLVLAPGTPKLPHLMLALLAVAAAFSPPPVFTDPLAASLPAAPAGTVRSFPDASMTMEQVQSWLWGSLEAEEDQEGEPEEIEGFYSGAVKTREEHESYQQRFRTAEIEEIRMWQDQEEGEGYAGEEGEGSFGEEGELILGPIESYAGDGKEKARAATVAEFLKAEEEDGSYEARMDEFLEAGEGEGFHSGEENEGTFEEEGESYDMDVEERARAAEFLKAYKAMEEGEEGPSASPSPPPSPVSYLDYDLISEMYFKGLVYFKGPVGTY